MSKMPYKIIKRIFDLLFSLPFLLICLPLLAIITLLIWLTDKGEIFVKDPLRKGLDGKEFRMYKFRTMIPNAHQEILNNPKYAQLKQEWQENGNKLKIDKDLRITKIGKFLRKTDLDEIPQLINVIKAEMSLVGPRPMYKDEIERHLEKKPQDEKYLNDIFNVKPGITGLWQVSGRNEISFTERLKLDASYARNQNFFVDLKALIKTPYVVLTRKGAYE